MLFITVKHSQIFNYLFIVISRKDYVYIFMHVEFYFSSEIQTNHNRGILFKGLMLEGSNSYSPLLTNCAVLLPGFSI